MNLAEKIGLGFAGVYLAGGLIVGVKFFPRFMLDRRLGDNPFDILQRKGLPWQQL